MFVWVFFRLWKWEAKKAAKVGTSNDGEHTVTTRSQIEKGFDPDILVVSHVKLTVFVDRCTNILRFKLLLSMFGRHLPFPLARFKRRGVNPQIKEWIYSFILIERE